ncbi:MAG: T9SS type A sorting domain-containing protein [Paludibacter sp.]
MKKITFTLAFLAIICLSFTAKAGLISGKNPVITTDLALTDSLPSLASKTITWTFDFTSSGSTLDGSEPLVIYFWAPYAHSPIDTSLPLTNVTGTLKWTLTMDLSAFFGKKSGAFLESGKNACWFNIQQYGVTGDLTGGLNKTFPVTKMLPYLSNTTYPSLQPNVSGVPGGQTVLDQPITWSFDLDGTIFDKSQELFIWAWDPTNPETLSGRTGTYNSPSADNVTKLTWVSGMRWSITLTPTTFYGKTALQLQTSNPAGFYMLIRNKNGLIKSQAFAVPTNITVTGVSQAASAQFNAFPNPVVDLLTIQLKDNGFENMAVYDFKGSIISKQLIPSGKTQLNVNFENFGKGVYLVVLNGKTKTQSIKIVK